MARTFNGSSEFLTFAQMGLAVFGPGTCAAIVRRNGTSIATILAGQDEFEMGVRANADGNFIYLWNGSAVVNSGVTLVNADGWCLVAITKPTGTATVRGHKYSYTGGTWTHTDGSSGANTPTISGDTQIARDSTGGQFFGGDIEAVGLWAIEMTDSEIENLLPWALARWLPIQSVSGIWSLDQLAVTTIITDLSGFTAHQTARTGTAVADGPTGWDGWYAGNKIRRPNVLVLA
jgi:hypothetical protein